MAEVFCYPLTPVPLSLCHIDGTMLKSPHALYQLLLLILMLQLLMGCFFLHLLVDPPKTIGQTAIVILNKVLGSFNCRNIHLVFDKVISPSIKDIERNARSASSRQETYTITGPEQTRPTNWLNALRIDSFKTSLVEFLTTFWENDDLFPFFESSAFRQL